MALRHGARQIYDRIDAEEQSALTAIEEARATVRRNPDYALRQLEDAIGAIQEVHRIRHHELTELIQKAAPPLERRVEELERTVELLLARTSSNLIVLPDRQRKEGSG